jgi:nicotinamide-nucleotide amidase
MRNGAALFGLLNMVGSTTNVVHIKIFREANPTFRFQQTLKADPSSLPNNLEVKATAATMEIICVGNELLIGKVVNTNASWLGKRATSLGIAVKRITVCADDVEEMAVVFREGIARKPDFIVSTGGLGPTFDDKTLQGVARALGVKTAVNPEALRMVKARYEEYCRKRNEPVGEMTPERVKMAALPEGTVVVANPIGTAPAVRKDLDGTVLFVLPGVPVEMEAIFEDSIVPLLCLASGDVRFFEKSVFADGIFESNLAPLIDVVMKANPSVYIKSHVKREEGRPHIELHFTTSGKPAEHPEVQVEKASSELSFLILKAGGKVYSSMDALGVL